MFPCNICFLFNMKPTKKDKKNMGFSILELLLYIAILSILVVLITNTFITLSRGTGQSQARSEVDAAIRFASELIKQDIKNASTITTPATGGTSTTLSLVRGGVAIVYDVSAGALRRKEGAATPVNVTSPVILVGTPTFTRLENTNTVFSTTTVSLKVMFNFSYNSTSPDWSYTTSLQTSTDLY